MSTKKNKRLIDDLSENLQRTIKQYNPITLDTDTTPQTKDKGEEQLEYKDDDDEDNQIKSIQKAQGISLDYDNNNISFQHNSNPKTFNTQIKHILNSLDSFEESVNSDFKDLEQLLENSIEKELQKCYR